MNPITEPRMSHDRRTADSLNGRFEPASHLRGSVAVPGDKSISHRAAILATMSEGETVIENFLDARDPESTIKAIRKLGAEIPEGVNGTIEKLIRIRGVGLTEAHEAEIEVGNASTPQSLLAGWVSGQAGKNWRFDGDESIRSRQVQRLAIYLRKMGGEFEYLEQDEHPPFRVLGHHLKGCDHELQEGSAQVKSCILLAGLLADNETTVVEKKPSRDHTERMLKMAGADVSVEQSDDGSRRITVKQTERLALEHVSVPGDFSSAAFLAVAACLIPDSEVQLRGVGVNETRTGFLDILERMGASFEVDNQTEIDGEPVADLAFRSSSLRAALIQGAEVPRAIDELPLVALLGAIAEGETVVRDAEALRGKETDRIADLVAALSGIGVDIHEEGDGFRVVGREDLPGGEFDARKDHRLAMLGAVAGLRSEKGVTVHDFEEASISYPNFAEDLLTLVDA